LRVYPVVGESDDLIGCVSADDVKNLAREEWDRHRVAELVKPCAASNTVSPNTDALEALSKIRENGTGNLLVTERNHVLAVVTPKDIINFLAKKMRMEGHTMGPLPLPRG